MNNNKVEEKTILPNFLVIGALKSGTNSLYQRLRTHPQVFMCPVIEPSFFAYEGQQVNNHSWSKFQIVTKFSDYAALFQGADGKAAIGEVSPMYLVTPDAPERIKRYIPETKLIAILRHPVDRAYSQWQMELRNGTENINDFAQAIKVKKSMPDGTVRQRFVYGGRYYSLLKPYYDLFGRSRMCVLLFDQLTADPQSLFQRIYQFLEIDSPDSSPNLSMRYNEGGGVPRNPFWKFYYQNLHSRIAGLGSVLPSGPRDKMKKYYRKFKNQIMVKPPELSSQLRAELTELFRDDIASLQELIGQDLSIWLQN